MNTSTTSGRSGRASKLLLLAAIGFALALPASSHAQGNSNNTPAADHRQNGGQGNDGGSAPVPEPATWATMGTLAVAAVLFARRQLKQRDAS